MASILRSSKFVRYIAGFARNVIVNTPREFDGNLVNATQCLCGALPRNLATQASVIDQNLETSLRRIDQDVRKSGRISRRDIEDVLEEIRNARSATSSQSLLVIRCCGNLVPEELPETRTKLVQEIWNTLNKLNVPMDVSHYNALLRVYLENEHQFSPTEFLSELESKGIEPNRVTYQRLIARYCQVGDIEGATKILEYMREKQMSVNENVFNALIIGHSRSGDMDSAKGIVKVMTQAGLEPSADTYTTLLSGYAFKGDIETIMSIIEECESKEIFLLDKDYLDIIYALATSGYSQHIPAILGKVRKAIGYNQDAINVILRLINGGYEDAGYMILKSMIRGSKDDGTFQPSGTFFVKQLVKANRPVDKIIELCTKFEEEEMHDRALLIATETSLELANDNLAYKLLEHLHSRGTEIRQHYFWPLIVSKATDKTGKEIVNVLNKMREFGVNPSLETVKDYVIPNLRGKSTDILALLREGNISVAASAFSLVISLLVRNEIDEAAAIACRVPAYYNPEAIRRPLTIAFYKTNNLQSYISLLRTIFDSLDRKSVLQTHEEEEEPSVVDKADVIGSLILDLSSNHRNFVDNIEAVLNELVNQGLSISTPKAEKIEEKLGEKMTERISDLLGKLTSGELTPIPLEKKPLLTYVPSHRMDIPQLERLIHNLDAKNQETKGLKKQLFNLYYRAKDLEKMEKLVDELKQSNFVFSAGLYAQLADLYAYHGNLEKSLEYYDKIKELENEKFTLGEDKIIRISQLLINTGQFDEGIKILETTPTDRKEDVRNFTYSALVWRFLNGLAEEGAVEQLDKVFDTLVKKGFIEVNNVVLGPLVKVHLVQKDLDKALEKFEWCVNQFKATPWKNELACRLIQAEDAEKLQKLTDLSTTVHGEVNSLYDLVFAFVECGRIRQARKILETPGLQNRPQRIHNVCERYHKEGLVESLEGLKDATKDLNHIDRSDIYYQLLLSYIKQDEVDKAFGLWTQMQEEDLAPSDQFLNTLGNFLKKKGLEVPFAVPDKTRLEVPIAVPDKRRPEVPFAVPDHSAKLNVSKPKEYIQPRTTPQTIFRQKIKAGELDEALQIKNSSQEIFSVSDLSTLIEKLLQSGRLSEASEISLDIIDRGNLPISRVFRFLLNKLASVGDVDTMNRIGSKISREFKKIVSFDNRMCHANVVAGRAEEYLEKLSHDIENAKDEDITRISERFPRGGAYGILEKNPDLSEKYEALALEYAKKGIIGPLNVLWIYNFIEGNDQKAEQLWNEYLKASPRVMFQKIVQTARENQDENLAKKLIDHLINSNVTEGAIGNAYSCLLDILVSKEKHDEIVSTFELAVNKVSINYINRTAILRTKEVYEKLDKQFSYKVPPKTSKNSSEPVEEDS